MPWPFITMNSKNGKNAPATKCPESKHALLLKDDGVKRWYRNTGGKGKHH
jgi:hypothetical protein